MLQKSAASMRRRPLRCKLFGQLRANSDGCSPSFGGLNNLIRLAWKIQHDAVALFDGWPTANPTVSTEDLCNNVVSRCATCVIDSMVDVTTPRCHIMGTCHFGSSHCPLTAVAVSCDKKASRSAHVLSGWMAFCQSERLHPTHHLLWILRPMSNAVTFFVTCCVSGVSCDLMVSRSGWPSANPATRLRRNLDGCLSVQRSTGCSRFQRVSLLGNALTRRDGEGAQNWFLKSLHAGAQAEFFIHSFVDIRAHAAVLEIVSGVGIFSGSMWLDAVLEVSFWKSPMIQVIDLEVSHGRRHFVTVSQLTCHHVNFFFRNMRYLFGCLHSAWSPRKSPVTCVMFRNMSRLIGWAPANRRVSTVT